MTEEFTSIQVGEKFTLYNRGSNKLDGGLMESQERGYGFYFCIFLNNIHQSEIDTIRNDRVDMRVLLSKDGIVIPMFRFGDSALIFEAHFDPTSYEDDRALQIADDNNMLTIVAVDGLSEVVKVIRTTNLPLKFINVCYPIWKDSFKQNNYSERYKLFANTLQQKFSLEAMWKMSLDVGSLGESFDLNDIQK